MAKGARITRKIAESLAIQALGFMAGEPERLGAFLAATGIGPETIRKAAADPAFLRASSTTSWPTSRCCSPSPRMPK